MPEKEKELLLEVDHLSINFPVKKDFPWSQQKYVQAVSDVSFKVYKGETYGVVGESGCGKSTLANATLKFLTPSAGRVLFQGKDINKVSNKEFKELRKDMQMIFQDPFSSLNPRFDVLHLIGEPMLIRGYSEEEIKDKVCELLHLVGLSEKDLYRHASDFSGGQRQRIGIARAISLNPAYLVLDEPVSALDVSVHAQILNLLMDLQKQMGMTYLFISHNLAVVKNICTNMAVMYLGKIAECGETEKIFQKPLHPYTIALMSAVLDIDKRHEKERIILEGDIPSPIDPPAGCRFHQRCPQKVGEVCEKLRPMLIEIEPNHFVACHKYAQCTPTQEQEEAMEAAEAKELHRDKKQK